MAIRNVMASVAVKDAEQASIWYARLLGAPGTSPMLGLFEWQLPGGGVLQVYQAPERAGQGSFTLAVDDLAAELPKLDAIGLDTRERHATPRVKTVMVADPDGNHIALAEALDPSLAS